MTELIKKTAFCLLLSCFTFTIGAQTSDRWENSKVFGDAAVGLFRLEGDISADFNVSAGYRFTPLHAAFLEYRATGNATISTFIGMQGIGAGYRLSLRKGFIVKASVGKVLEASRGTDGFERFEYDSGGYWVGYHVSYQIRPSLTFGIFMTGVNAGNFDFFVYDTILDIENFVGQSRSNFVSGGISFGIALPGRGKKFRT